MWSLTSAIFLILLNRVLSDISFSYNQLYEGSPCRLRNGVEGICVKAINCPARLHQILIGDYSSTSGRCGFKDFDEIFCCAKESHRSKLEAKRPAEIACENHKKSLNDMAKHGPVYTSLINGVLARQGEFPHMAALGYLMKDGGAKYACGGTLISEKHVLTAAHCVNNVNGLIPHKVVLGTEDLRRERDPRVQHIRISRIIKHPEYRRTFGYHDLAILELENPANFTTDVHPTCLMTKPLSMSKSNKKKFDSLLVLGWGVTDLDRTMSKKLMKADRIKFSTKKKCCKRYANVHSYIPNGLDDSMICVRGPNVNRSSDTCWGDSGGPLLIPSEKLPRLIGVTSFGEACGGDAPGVYVSVYKYLNWIEDVVWPKTFSFY